MRDENKLEEKFAKFMDDEIYSKKYADWTRERIHDRKRQISCGDVFLKKGDYTVYVDEKAFNTVWDNCLIEIIQDLAKQDIDYFLGWFFNLSACTHLIYGYYETKESAKPSLIYKVDWKALKKRYLDPSHDKEFRYVIANGGYGKTLNAITPWDLLLGEEAEVLYKSISYTCTFCGRPSTTEGECEYCRAANMAFNEVR